MPNKAEKNRMILLIGGHPRSGTTMLRELCDGHPEMTITLELASFMFVGQSWRKYTRQLIKNWSHADLIEPRTPQRSGPKDTLMRRGIRSMRRHLYTTRYLLSMSRYRKGSIEFPMIASTLYKVFRNTPIVGDKWPYYALLLDEIVPWVEHGARCVVIYRDCRDVTRSVLRKVRTSWKNQKWAEQYDSPEKVAAIWVQHIELMERHTDKIHAICYENLVRNRREEISKLANYLGVDPEGFRIQMIQDDRIGQYRSELTDEQVAAIERIAGPAMVRLGYDLTTGIMG